ncbi:MAG: PQQ-binding-like beta-propeller repeat protein [Candidatus Aminicenantes bacterium]|jgi:outer membrane protein assembly factor BamB
MKKPNVAYVSVVLVVLFVMSSCSLFRKKIAPYPSGIMFPVEEAHQIPYKGEINNPMKKRGTLIFISTRAGILYCVESSSQKIQWQVQFSKILASPPFLGQENIYVLDQDNNLFCLTEGGDILWQRIIEAEITSRIIEFRGNVCMGTSSGWFFAIDILEGKRTWAFKAQDAIRSNPVVSDGKIIFGSDDQNLYVLSARGNLIHKFAIGGKIGATLAANGDSVYFGTSNREILCFDLKKQKRKWKVRTGGELLVPPVFYANRAYFACMDNVLYCLNKKGGDILWWSVTPSRAFYHLMIVNDRIVVTSLSSLLMSFDVKTGEKVGEFQGSEEIRSNPLWSEPYMLVNRYDSESDQGTLLFFQKLVAVELLPSKISPQKINEVIVITVTPFGFYLPEYEFSLMPLVKWSLNPYFFVLLGRQEEKRIVQERSEERTWEWFPVEAGFYSIGVTATDEKEKAECELPFLIQEEEAAVVLAISKKSPQKVGSEIIFTATSTGMSSPKYEFSLRRVIKVAFFTSMTLYVPGRKRVVMDYSEENSWTWIPPRGGLYAISVFANDGTKEVSSNILFSITKKNNQDSEKKNDKTDKNGR